MAGLGEGRQQGLVGKGGEVGLTIIIRYHSCPQQRWVVDGSFYGEGGRMGYMERKEGEHAH